MDIGPEFLDYDGEGVVSHLGSPDAESIRQSTIGLVMNIGQHARRRVVTTGDKGPGMIAVSGNCSRQGAAYDFRVVELRFAGIGPGDEDPADGIFSPSAESTFAGLKIAGILMQHRREDRAGEEVFDGSISKCCRVALSVAFPTLPITRLTVFCLTDGR